MGSTDALIQKAHEEFECQRCGRCCIKLIRGGELELYENSLVAWRERPDLFYHPWFDYEMKEFGSAGVMNGWLTTDEAQKDLDECELHYQLKHGKPIKFLWGGLLHECPFLKKDDIHYGCLLHDDPAKPEVCIDWPMRDEISLKEARKIGCKGLEFLESRS